MSQLAKTAYWSKTPEELFAALTTSPAGLSDQQAMVRGQHKRKRDHRISTFDVFFNQFKSPIILLLIAAAVLSYYLQAHSDTAIILTIVIASGLLGFWQEIGARNAVSKLLALVETRATVIREGKEVDVPADQLVPGDIVLLSAGATLGADCVLFESKDIFMDEAALTGETFPVEKHVARVNSECPLPARSNCLFMGTHVVSGIGKAVVVAINDEAIFGRLAKQLEAKTPETDFEKGIRQFGALILELTLILVIAIFAFNVFLARPVLQSLMFSLALAVGLTPQLLPAVISINLANGAKRMAESKVIVKRLSAIETFGSMNVLCTDKTGTLTEGTVTFHSAVDLNNQSNAQVLEYAYLNAQMESGFSNPIDAAIRGLQLDISASVHKLDEVPYDFIRKRISVLVANEDGNLLISKGAVSNTISVCSHALFEGELKPIADVLYHIQKLSDVYSSQGLRTLAVASKSLDRDIHRIASKDERDMTLVGFITFEDPPKPEIIATLESLRKLGIRLKIITGDNRQVALAVSHRVGLQDLAILGGHELSTISDSALPALADKTDVFCEVEPNQKARIITALRKAGNVVGYVGDGINDAAALHASDVGISVNNAVDVAKEAAQIVMLEHDLSVLIEAVKEGRRTFANTLKYIFMATSANFGNMFSMAGASLFLPFLPLLPKQVLLTNLLTDIPELTIVTDSVDSELTQQPGRWDIHFIRKFMFVFGILSSIFDCITFVVLAVVLQATPDQFRTGWFVESVVSACLIVLVIRTRRPLLHSSPSRPLLVSTLLVALLTPLLPLPPVAGLFDFTVPPIQFGGWLLFIIVLYVSAAELTKRVFYGLLLSKATAPKSFAERAETPSTTV